MNIEQQQQVMSSKFAQDLLKPLNINGRTSSRGFYNMLLHIYGLKMQISIGLVPNRNWKLKHIKEYYNISGTKETLLAKLEFIKKEMLCL